MFGSGGLKWASHGDLDFGTQKLVTLDIRYL